MNDSYLIYSVETLVSMYFKYLVGTWACAVVKYAGHVYTRYTTVRMYMNCSTAVSSRNGITYMYVSTERDIVPRCSIDKTRYIDNPYNIAT